jgi:hypothetical protein
MNVELGWLGLSETINRGHFWAPAGRGPLPSDGDPPSGRPRGRIACRSEDDDALRPCPTVSGPIVAPSTPAPVEVKRRTTGNQAVQKADDETHAAVWSHRGHKRTVTRWHGSGPGRCSGRRNRR